MTYVFLMRVYSLILQPCMAYLGHIYDIIEPI